MYRWPVIDQVTVATARDETTSKPLPITAVPKLLHRCTESAASIVLRRRSAQHFDGKYTMPAQDFFLMLDCTLPRPDSPWELLGGAARVHPVIFVHRVQDVAPGIYVLVRNAETESALRQAMKNDFAWTRVAQCPDHLPLFQLTAVDYQK